MSLLKNYAIYRWWTSDGNGGGGGGGDGAGIAIIMGYFALLAVILIALQLVYAAFMYVWGIVHSYLDPVVSSYPLITVPLMLMTIVWLLTRVGPYSGEKIKKKLDGIDGDGFSFSQKTAVGVLAINISLVAGQLFSPDDFGELMSGLVAALNQVFSSQYVEIYAVAIFLICGIIFLPISLFAVFSMVHLPYKYMRILLSIPKGAIYTGVALTPLLILFIIPPFSISIALPASTPTIFTPEWSVIPILLLYTNIAYLGGAIAILWKEDEIRENMIADINSDSDDESEQDDESNN